MASVMGICGGLMGPKSEKVGFSSVLPLLFEGSRGHGTAKESFPAERPGVNSGRFEVQKVILLIKNACGYIQNCASYPSGEHNSRIIMKKSAWKVKNGAGRA